MEFKISWEFVVLVMVIVIVIVLLYLIFKRSHQCESPHSNISVGMAGPAETDRIYAKSETLPVFMRHDGNERRIVTAKRIKPTQVVEIPYSYDTRQKFKGWMAPVQNQGECGSCWAFSSCGAFGDRIKIASNGTKMNPKDVISPYAFAACAKCDSGHGTVCRDVCDGHYMDEVMNQFRKHGAYSLDTVNRFTNYGTQYICYKPKSPSEGVPFKATRGYRVNPYTMGELDDPSRRLINEQQIMYDIFKFGPVTCTIRVFDPLNANDLSKNFYLYKEGVYGYPWKGGDPAVYDGYHAMCIIGWGVEHIQGVDVKYWILRNSWGEEWGMRGYGKILRGENRAIVETDVWAQGVD